MCVLIFLHLLIGKKVMKIKNLFSIFQCKGIYVFDTGFSYENGNYPQMICTLLYRFIVSLMNLKAGNIVFLMVVDGLPAAISH